VCQAVWLVLKFKKIYIYILNELLKHVSVHVYDLRGEHNANSVKPSSTAKLLCQNDVHLKSHN